MVRRDDSGLDRGVQRQVVGDAAEQAVGVIGHGGDELVLIVAVARGPDAGGGGHVEARGGRDPRVVVDDGPGFARPAAGAVRLVHDDQAPGGQAAFVGGLQDAVAEGGVGREDGDALVGGEPHQGVGVGGVRESCLVVVEGGDPHEGAGAAAVPPGAGGLVEEVQGGDQNQDALPADLFGGPYGNEGLAAARGHDDLRAQASGRELGGGAVGKFLNRAGQGLALVRAQRVRDAGVSAGHALALLSGARPWGRGGGRGGAAVGVVGAEVVAVAQPAPSACAQPGAVGPVLGHRDGSEPLAVALVAVAGPGLAGVVAPDGRDVSGGHGRVFPAAQIAYSWRT